MKLNINLLGILAILCVMISSGAVCAHSDAGHMGIDSENYAVELQDEPIEQTDINEENAIPNENGNSTIIPADAGHQDPDLVNALHAAGGDLNATTNSTGNSTHAAGGDLNATTNSTGNSTHAAGGDLQNATAHKLPATGNPILLVLLAAIAAGSALVIKRKK